MANDRPSEHIDGLPGPASELPWSDDFVMQAIELLLVTAHDGAILSLRPLHADSFVVGWPARAKPEDVAGRAVRGLGFEPVVLHSTSWRNTGDEVVLTYLGVVKDDQRLPDSWQAVPVGHADLARGGATTPPPVIAIDQVLEHALRHLAWLVQEDSVIAIEMPGWRDLLAGYVPEPFRNLGGEPRLV